MKARIILFSLLFLAACQPVELDMPDQISSDKALTLTIQASKIPGQAGNDGQTKALWLDQSGTTETLNAYWLNTETVKVYKDGALIGTLNVTPDTGEKPAKATLSGTVTVTGLAVGNQLTLLIPRETWDYSGQNGLLTGDGSIEKNNDYATASVTVESISGSTVTTSGATFANAQSIYRFGFKDGDSYIDPKSFTITANGGQLVQSVSFASNPWSPVYGSLTVIPPATKPTDHLYYVALRNDRTTDDTYSFVIIGSDDALHMASKAIPTSVLNAPGKFISATAISAPKTTMAPMTFGIVTEASEVY